jgi:hypothetical protein
MPVQNENYPDYSPTIFKLFLIDVKRTIPNTDYTYKVINSGNRTTI